MIHPDAQAEFDDIMRTGSTTQCLVSTLCWMTVVQASKKNSTQGLVRIGGYMKGPLFYKEEKFWTPLGRKIVGKVVAGHPTATRHLTTLACDVSASPWWHGSAPENRAAARM